MFVTSDPVTGKLTLQFGSPALPVITDINIPRTTSTSNTLFNTNRFTGPGDGTYVIDDDYRITLTYTTASSNIFLSASILAQVNGVETEILSSSDYNGGSPQTFNISDSPYLSYFHSGSHVFTGSVNVTLEDNSNTRVLLASSTATNQDANLSKNAPSQPTITFNYSGLGNGTTYVSNHSNLDNTSNIEKGESGIITFTSSSGTLDGWNSDGITTTSNSSPITVTQTGGITTVEVEEGFSTTSGSDSVSDKSRSKSFNRIVSLRVGVALNSQSFTETELLDLDAWTDGSEIQGDTIYFNTTTIANNTQISMTNITAGYLCIVYDATQNDLNNIFQADSSFGTSNNVLSSFTKTTDGIYKMYITTNKNSPATQYFVLNKS